MDLFTFENFFNLLMLVFLQAVLGFDNLLYISLQSKRAPLEKQKFVRFWGIIMAVLFRIILLFVVVILIDKLKEPFFEFTITGILTGGVNFSTIVFFFGGIFIIYTAVTEIHHLISSEHLEGHKNKRSASTTQLILIIVLMNLIFSFDSILSALAITEVMALLVLAIIISGIAMLVLADNVAEFLEKNKMFEILGLFILLIVGIVLIGEAGPAAAHANHNPLLQISIFNYELQPMSKSTFYFSVLILFLVEIIQSSYSRMLKKK